MSKELSVILLGVAVVIVPYLGIPGPWRTLFLLIAGLVLIVIGLLLRAQGMAQAAKNSPHHPFVENNTATTVHDHSAHEHKEGLTSLN